MALPRRSFRFAVVALLALPVAWGIGAGAGCGPNQSYFWVCFDPGTGHDGSYYDANHYVNGVADPCHCYDPCGPADTCPLLVDAGPRPPGCDGGGGGSDGG